MTGYPQVTLLHAHMLGLVYRPIGQSMPTPSEDQMVPLATFSFKMASSCSQHEPKACRPVEVCSSLCACLSLGEIECSVLDDPSKLPEQLQSSHPCHGQSTEQAHRLPALPSLVIKALLPPCILMNFKTAFAHLLYTAMSRKGSNR